MNITSRLMDLKRSWSPPSGLDRSRPREARLTGNGKALVLLAVVIVAGAIGAGVGLGMVTRRQAEEARLFQEEGAIAHGQVTEIWRKRGEKKQSWITYRFTSGGRSYGRSAKISRSVWQGLWVGSEIAVHHIPSNPALNYPIRFAKKPMPTGVVFAVAGALAVFGFLALLPILKAWRLLTKGRPAPGIVTRHGKIERSSHGAVLGRSFYYEFPLLNGATAKGKSGPSKNPPVIGSTLCVLYDPNTPRKNAPYPLSLVKPAHLRTR